MNSKDVNAQADASISHLREQLSWSTENLPSICLQFGSEGASRSNRNLRYNSSPLAQLAECQLSETHRSYRRGTANCMVSSRRKVIMHLENSASKLSNFSWSVARLMVSFLTAEP